MSTIAIPNRPFSTDTITGFMLPDGIFEATLGNQLINAYFNNSGAATDAGSRIYVESVSHPGIAVTPFTHIVGALAGGAARVLSWEANFTGAPPGTHFISFIVETAAGRDRIIKKIFVTRVQFDGATTTFRAETPEGTLIVGFRDLVIPADVMCCGKRRARKGGKDQESKNDFLDNLGKLFTGHKSDFVFCPPGYLPLDLEATVIPTPPYSGQYGDLPFEDPWWKVVLCIIAVILLIAAAVAASEEGGEVVVTTGGGGGGGPGEPDDCCGVSASGGSDSYVVAGLVAGAAAAATAAAASDVRDPFRRGEDNTAPAAGEMTLSEHVKMSFHYPEPVALGRPFAAGLKWEYTRVTTGATYSFAASDVSNNVHVLSNYKITAPEIIHSFYRYKEPFVVRAEFFDKDEKQFKGGQLLVQCFLVGPNGEYRKFRLQDDGIPPDEKPSDGIFTGFYDFSRDESPQGLWLYYVIAQDINNADPDMTPEEAAKIIGGMVVTHQLTITFDEDECPFVPDGHVQVL